ncbi:MAG TPA: antitoxin VbhA family protein [Alphaproteobacteria bacterium]|nr:antitoxin VbhA family protein [Alphaproteobacteria bacterium]
MLGARKQKPIPPAIDEQEKQRRLEAYRNAEASLRIEGLSLDNETKDVFEMWVDGKITSEEKTKRIRELVSQLSE